MGKKSKRTRNKQNAGGGGSRTKNVVDDDPHQPAPALRKKNEDESLKETMDNLRFEDPFEDEYEEEDIVDDEEPMSDNNNNSNNNHNNKKSEIKMNLQPKQSWTPLTHALSSGEKLEMDITAYRMYHSLAGEWPSLSFDFIRDTWGDARNRFPHSLLAVAGTQAERSEWNRLVIMKMTDLHGTGINKKNKKRKDDDELASSDDDSDNDGDDDSSIEDENDDDDDDDDSDPVLEHISLPHRGGVNRLRVMPTTTTNSGGDTSTSSSFLNDKCIVATWSEEGCVNLYNLQSCLDRFERSSGKFIGAHTTHGEEEDVNKPFFTYSGHKSEGFAIDWSSSQLGQMATGDCEGDIHLWKTTETTFHVDEPASYEEKQSVEDIQWSPTESTVFASALCGGCIQIYDTRRTKKSMLSVTAHENKCDVNVIAWNANVTNLLASGGDDGTFSVWDLRTFGGGSTAGGKKGGGRKVEPLARFTCHKKPITSLEWHPTDESMIVVTDDDAAFVYDLSVEADPEEENNDITSTSISDADVPPQLLFVHCGSELTKDAHWHPQIPSLLMTTALSGYNVFIPSNL